MELHGIKIIIDPYLSNSLAKKYQGTIFPHKRMMPIPIDVDELPEPDIVLLTHAHSDHMDEETIGPLANRFSSLEFIVPQAVIHTAKERIGAQHNIQGVNAHDIVELSAKCHLTVFPAAHETFEKTSANEYPYLGYGISTADVRLYHSGDTVPFPGLVDLLTDFAPDIALLPVNGRDETRRTRGVPGNMTLEEAVDLCQQANIAHCIPHHFGMFSFNTIDVSAIERVAAATDAPRIICPKPHYGYRIKSRHKPTTPK